MTFRRLRLDLRAASALAALTLAAPLCTATAAPTDVVAREGTLLVTAGQVTEMLDHLDPATRAKVLGTPGALSDVVRGRLATEALLAEAQSKNWAAQPAVARQIAAARDQTIVQTYIASVSQPDPGFPTDAMVQQAYDANKAQFVVPRSDHLSQILVPGGTDDAAHKRALAAARNFNAGKPSDLGFVPENRLQPEIHDAIAGLPPGGTTPPIHLQDGWHIIRLVATNPAAPAPLSAFRPQIVDALRRQKTQQDARAYVANLQQKQHLEINEIALSQAAGR